MRIFARVLRIFAENPLQTAMRKILNERIAISSSNPIRARFYDYRGFTYPWHFHSEYELMYVEQGYGRCLVGDSIIDYRAGDLIFFGSGLPHCMQNCPEAQENETYHVCGVNVQLEKISCSIRSRTTHSLPPSVRYWRRHTAVSASRLPEKAK